jgi:hypothetical protein
LLVDKSEGYDNRGWGQSHIIHEIHKSLVEKALAYVIDKNKDYSESDLCRC